MVTTPSSPVGAAPGLASSRRDWLLAASALVFGLCAFAIIFGPEVTAAVGVWIGSTTFNHCFLVIPIAAYLAWDRRKAALGCSLRPRPWIAVLAIPLASLWFMADRLGIMEGRQLIAMCLFQIMVASVIGIRTWCVLAAPLLYLFFLVPFGEWMVPELQRVTARVMAAGLDLFHVPNFSHDLTVQIPEGTFYVAEACSGFRFLIASTAFGVLYAWAMYRSLFRRLCFVALSLVVPVVANGVRAFGIVLLAHFIGAKAVELDHVAWGWYFFSFVIIMLILAGLPFRQDQLLSSPRKIFAGATRHPDPVPIKWMALAIAVVPIILLAATPRIVSEALDTFSADKKVAAAIKLPALDDCILEPAGASTVVEPAEPSLGIAHASAYRCGAEVFVLYLYRFPSRTSARPIFSLLHAVIDPPGWETITSNTVRGDNRTGGPLWQVTEVRSHDRYRTVATALWIGGQPITAGISARVGQALNSIRRSAVCPVIAVIAYSGGDVPRDIITNFLLKTEPLTDWVRRWIAEPVTKVGG